MRRRRILVAGSLAALMAVIVVLVGGVFGRVALTRAEATNPHTIAYRNTYVNEQDTDKTNDYNFGWDVWERANEAVSKGEAPNPLAYIWDLDSETRGDFYKALWTDPALCAAVALDIDERLNFEEKILKDEQDVAIGQRADKAHLHFIKDAAYWDRAIDIIVERFQHAEIKIVEITGYKSSMYMIYHGLMNERPSVVVRESTNSGGHMLVVDFGPKIGVLKYRLECGYQPVDVTYWQPPQGSKPIPDNPTPPEPPEPEKPTPDQPLKPKDPNAGPQGQDPNNPDFGGGPNHDPDKTVTSEPQSPETYTPPAPPQGETEVKPGQPAGDAIDTRDTESGSQVVDTDNGKTEQHNGEDYTVVAGDGQNHTPLEDVYNQHNDNTVEEPIRNDPPAVGEIGAPE